MTLIPIQITVQEGPVTQIIVGPESTSQTAANIAIAAKNTAVQAVATLQPLLDDLAAMLELQGDLTQLNTVYDNLTQINAVYQNLAVINTVEDNLTALNTIVASIDNLNTLYANLADLLNLEAALAHILAVEAKLPEIEAVYGKLTEITSINNNLDKLTALYNDLSKLNTLYDNLAVLEVLHTNLAAFQALHTNLAALLNIESNLTQLTTLHASLTELLALHTNLSKLTALYDNLAALQSIHSNLAGILAAEAHATTATTQAGIATTQAELAESYATAPENTEVEPGKFSALHHAAKAEGFATTAEDYKDDAADSATLAQTLANSISLGGIFYDETEALRLRVIADGGTFIKPMRLVDPEMDAYQGINTPILTNLAAYKAGRLYSIRPSNGTADFTCVRATTPNRVNQQGVTEVVPINTPVIDWTTGSPLLIVSEVGEITLTNLSTATKVVITIGGVDTEYNNVFPTLTLPVGSISKIIATSGGVEYDLLRDYLLRVDTATGTTDEQGAKDLKAMYEFLEDEGLLDNTELLYLANAGMVQRTDGVLKYVRTAFDASNDDRDLDGSATASQQPRLVGGIAPNSKVAAANLNGESRFFTHPEISFTANQAWSVSTLINFTSKTDNSGIYGGNTNLFNVRLIGTTGVIRIFYGASNYITGVSVHEFLGKTALLTLTYNNGELKVYINGLIKHTVALSFAISLNALNAINITGTVPQNQNYLAHHIQSSALTAEQALALYNQLSSMYPEIESTTIGTQTWATRNFEAVATPLGNVIANVTENGAVEKITQPFNLLSSFTRVDTNTTISDSDTFAVGPSGGGGVFSGNILTAGKYYRVKYSGNISNGNAVLFQGTNPATRVQISTEQSGGFSFNIIFKASASTQLNIYLRNTLANSTTDVSEISIQELNWSNATEIYNAVYAATAGDAATKEYAALKEAAAWAYHNNSVDLGAVYGKIYNGYGKDLLVDDIALQGSWGYHVATEAELTTLATNGGYALKYEGTDYWTTTGGTNTTGFTALGGGTRSDVDGSFSTIKDTTAFWCADSDKVLLLNHADNTATITAVDKMYGAYVRLVED